MATVAISCSLGIHKSSRTLFVSVSPFFFFVNSSCITFFEAFTCLIRKNLTNIFKTERHVEQTKAPNWGFLWRHPCICTLIVSGQRPITELDCKTVGFFLKIGLEYGRSRVKASRAQAHEPHTSVRHVRQERKKGLPQSRSPFSASVLLFVLTVYLNTQKFGLFCSLSQRA